MPSGPRPRLPLFPLPDVVHFPRTELRLHVFEPRYRRLLRDLEEREEGLRWIGIVLLRPEPELAFGPPPRIFPEGTAGLLVDVEPLPDGRSNILLQGEFRFTVEQEIEELATPYRQAVVRPLREVAIDEEDAGVVAVRRDLMAVAEALSGHTGRRFPLDPPALEELAGRASFEVLVNTLAAELDLPPTRKLQLLEQALPERALEVLGILRSRRRVVDLLRPFRHLADAAERN